MTSSRRGESFVQPPAFREGSVVAVFSPSSASASRFPLRALRGAMWLEKRLGAIVRLGEPAQPYGYRAGAAPDLARRLEVLFQDPDVALIICAIGGFNSNSLLECLDWDLLRRHPTQICGYSDSTALLLAIHGRTRQVVLHGPALLPQWGDPNGPLPETVQSFHTAITGQAREWLPVANNYWMSPRTQWENENSSFHNNSALVASPKILRSGKAHGQLLGGNIETMNMLLGTPYAPDFEGRILFLEATGAEAFLPRLQRALVHLRLVGVFERIAGLVVGRCPDATGHESSTLEDVILEVTQGTGFPIVSDIDIGHTEPIPTLPIGCNARLSALADSVSLTLLEPAAAFAGGSA